LFCCRLQAAFAACARYELAACFWSRVLSGIGFTMSIFITNLAFAGNPDTINASKMAILLASLTAGAAGFLWLRSCGKPVRRATVLNTKGLMLPGQDAEDT